MISRNIYNRILFSIENKPVTLITGARQVGKSTLCYKLEKERNFNYISLDNQRERQMAIQDPELFLQLHPYPLIIDEVQYAPELFEIIEQLVNEKKKSQTNNHGMFVLTGSQAYALMENVTQSLAGRVSIIHMNPLSMSEIHNVKENPFQIDILQNKERTDQFKISIDELYTTIVRGFYPELYANSKLDSEQFYSDYVETYLNRDVSQMIQIKNKLKFQNFLEILASLTGQELIYDNLAKQVGVDKNTIQSWISILIAGDIIYLLQPYNEFSIVKRVVKRPKIYFSDTGLACFLTRLSNPQILQNSFFADSFVETYIVNEIRKSYLNNGKIANFYYYRDSNQNEIDLIILYEGELTLVECKSGIAYTKKNISGFKQMEHSKYKVKGKCILCTTDTIYPLTSDAYALPISSI